MIDLGIDPGRERRRIRPGVQLRHHQRPVHFAFDEVDQHLGADARRELRTPIRPGQRFCHPYPSAGRVVARRIAFVVSVVRQPPRVAGRAALPGELEGPGMPPLYSSVATTSQRALV